MTKLHFTVLATTFVLVLTGCAGMSETQRDTATGAGIGAATGAVIGAIAGGSRGAAIGAGVGAGLGAGGGLHLVAEYAEAEAGDGADQSGMGIAVTQTPDNQLKLNIPNDISFDTGRAEIKPAMRPILDRFAEGLRTNPAATCGSSGIPTARATTPSTTRFRCSAPLRCGTTSWRVASSRIES